MHRPVLACGVALATTALFLPSSSGTPTGARPEVRDGGGFQAEHAISRDKDTRGPRVAPSAQQRAAATRADAVVRWNDFGTPAVLLSTDQPLASGLPADPAAAAREYVTTRHAELGLTDRAANSLELLTVAPFGKGAAVIFRQRFGDLTAGYDGLLTIGVRDGAVRYVSSSLARDSRAPASATLSATEASRFAASDAGIDDAKVLSTELVAMPMPGANARAAYQIVLGSQSDVATAYASYVDARDGKILVREDLVDHDVDNPEWDVFPSSPPTDYSSTDTRQHWCFFPGAGCDEVVGTSASPLAWDVDPATGASSDTTLGNNAFAVHNWFSNDPFSVGTELATPRPDRDYSYAWTNQWYEESCNPTTFESPERADIDAARANLFAMHNRMHDWSYHLGFTEETWNMQEDNFDQGGLGDDPEQGNAQAGGVSGGPPTFAARDNANQITPPDGVAPITNMYMWQPIAGAPSTPRASTATTT